MFCVLLATKLHLSFSLFLLIVMFVFFLCYFLLPISTTLFLNTKWKNLQFYFILKASSINLARFLFHLCLPGQLFDKVLEIANRIFSLYFPMSGCWLCLDVNVMGTYIFVLQLGFPFFWLLSNSIYMELHVFKLLFLCITICNCDEFCRRRLHNVFKRGFMMLLSWEPLLCFIWLEKEYLSLM